MGRPRKSDHERLVPVKTALRPDRFDQLDRVARARGVSLSELIRERLDPRFREPKTRSHGDSL